MLRILTDYDRVTDAKQEQARFRDLCKLDYLRIDRIVKCYNINLRPDSMDGQVVLAIR